MAYVIAEPCINTKDSSCVNVCPVDCIHPRKDENFEPVQQLYIDPDTCIDCGACVPECPVSAIFPEPDVRALLAEIRPDIQAKGTDYTVESVPEGNVVTSYGGRVAIVGDPKDHSATEIIRTHLSSPKS